MRLSLGGTIDDVEQTLTERYAAPPAWRRWVTIAAVAVVAVVGLGWLAWAWDDPASAADDTWFALSKNGKYDSTADLTLFGKAVVEDATYGLLKLAKPATGI